MRRYCDEWIQEWCQDHGWTDLFREKYQYWAFPPNAVMPVPIPQKVLLKIKAQRGLSPDERKAIASGISVSLLSAFSSYWFASPMPLVVAFACWAILVGLLEEED